MLRNNNKYFFIFDIYIFEIIIYSKCKSMGWDLSNIGYFVKIIF